MSLTKTKLKNILLLQLLGLLLTACSMGASEDAQTIIMDSNLDCDLSITGVSVKEETSFTIYGDSTCPQNTHATTQLFENGQSVIWWPADYKVSIQEDGSWVQSISLKNIEEHSFFDVNSDYSLHVWIAENPEIVSIPFPFDLSGPPTS